MTEKQKPFCEVCGRFVVEEPGFYLNYSHDGGSDVTLACPRCGHTWDTTYNSEPCPRCGAEGKVDHYVSPVFPW